MDHYTLLGNCPPTPPLNRQWHFSLRAKCWLRGGVGGQSLRNVYWSNNFGWKVANAVTDSSPVVSYYLQAVTKRSRETNAASGAKRTMGRWNEKGSLPSFHPPSSHALPLTLLLIGDSRDDWERVRCSKGVKTQNCSQLCTSYSSGLKHNLVTTGKWHSVIIQL